MARNKKAEFAVKILLEYAKENGINVRDTTDLSPLEQWLILRLYNVVVPKGTLIAFAKYVIDFSDNINYTPESVVNEFLSN